MELLIQTSTALLKCEFFSHAQRKKLQPPQNQARQPGREYKMRPRPRAENEKQRGSGKLQNKIALITGGDSGIGRAVAIAFAKKAQTSRSSIWRTKRCKRDRTHGRRMGSRVFANRRRHWSGKILPKSSRGTNFASQWRRCCERITSSLALC